MKVAFQTLGCKVNQYETEAMQKLFSNAGYELTEKISDAEIVVVNTCTVTAVSSQKSRQMIRRAAKVNKNSVLIVVGCLAQSSPQEISEIDGVDIIIGTADRMKIVQLAEKVLQNREEKIFKVREVENISEFEELPHTPQRTRAFLKIEDGCNNFCSYCIIPYIRGRVRSRSLESIRAESFDLAEKNFKEIVLTGIHIGAYGKDFSEKITLTDAVKVVLDSAKPLRLRLGSIEPQEMTAELFDLMKNNSGICNHLHLPLQSGSDEILKSMHRPYSTKNFSDLTSKIVAEIPDISIGTDLIVGFPGETEKNFEETLKFLQTQPFSKIHVFPFSLREGTLAAEMKNQIDSKTKKIRVAEVLKLAKAKENFFAEKLVGKTVEIISETLTDGIIDGLTKNYVRVNLPAEKDIPLGEVIKVKIEKISLDKKNNSVAVGKFISN